MTEVSASVATVPVTVRFFAAASAAAGAESRILMLRPGATIGDAISELRDHSDELARVLQKCSFLRDGVAVRDLTVCLGPDQTLDVLPPFAGG